MIENLNWRNPTVEEQEKCRKAIEPTLENMLEDNRRKLHFTAFLTAVLILNFCYAWYAGYKPWLSVVIGIAALVSAVAVKWYASRVRDSLTCKGAIHNGEYEVLSIPCNEIMEIIKLRATNLDEDKLYNTFKDSTENALIVFSERAAFGSVLFPKLDATGAYSMETFIN